MAVILGSTGITFPDATTQTTAASGGGQIQSQLFTSSGSWTAPTGVTKVRVSVIGGGGGAGSNGCGGGAGGGGGYGLGFYTVTPGTAYTVTVGGGGAGVNSSYGTGTSGGTSSFGALLSATGGAGGGVSADGANGSASSANIRNNNIATTPQIAFFGGQGGLFGTTQPAQTWSVSSKYTPGACGYTFNDGSKGNGGMSGIVYVEWVG